MENEVTKEEVKKSEGVVEQKKESKDKSGENEVLKAEGKDEVSPEQTTKKNSIQQVKDFVLGTSRTTKTFVVVLALFALFSVIFYTYRGVFVVAMVNGSPISRLSVVKELENKAGSSIVETMITKKLIDGEMKKSNIKVNDADIDAEMKKIEEQVTAQGGTLEQALASQGMTVKDLRDQIIISKQLEQALGDKVTVSDEEVNQYMTDNKAFLPKGTNSEDLKEQIRAQLKEQKFNTEAEKWVNDLKEKAKIQYFVQY